MIMIFITGIYHW